MKKMKKKKKKKKMKNEMTAGSCQQDSTDIQLNPTHLIEMYTALQNVMNSTLTNETRLRILLFKETYGKYEPIFEKNAEFLKFPSPLPLCKASSGGGQVKCWWLRGVTCWDNICPSSNFWVVTST